MTHSKTKFNIGWLKKRDGNGHMLEWWCHEHKTNTFKAICKLCDKKIQVANNRCFTLMQHAGMKSHKKKASVRLAFARKDSVLHKEKETVEPSPSSSSEQSRTEIQCSETSPGRY